MFKNGKVVCTGNKTMQDIVQSCADVSMPLAKDGLEVQIGNVKVVNMTMTFDLGIRINLPKLAEYIGTDAIYAPEIYPAIVFSEGFSKTKCLVFHTGKVIVTGATTKAQLKRLFREFRERLTSFLFQK